MQNQKGTDLFVVGEPDGVALLEETLEVLDESAGGEVLQVLRDVLHRGHAAADDAEARLALGRGLGQVGDQHLWTEDVVIWYGAANATSIRILPFCSNRMSDFVSIFSTLLQRTDRSQYHFSTYV